MTATSNEKIIWDFLYNEFQNAYGISGLLGNLYAESGLNPKNLQNTFEKKLGYTDETYTAAVDNGTYNNFIHDGAGYGIYQLTYYSRKQNFLNYVKKNNASIGDLTIQLEFLIKELKSNYPSIYNTLKTATSVKEASNAVLLKFERPADQSSAAQAKRASYGQNYYNKYATDSSISSSSILKKGSTGTAVKILQQNLIALGYDVGKDGADGDFGVNTEAALKAFQKDNDLAITGQYESSIVIKMEELLKKKNESTAASPITNKITITGGTVNVRSGPAKTYASIGIVKKGETYESLDITNWIPITYEGVNWVSKKYVKVSDNHCIITGNTVNIRSGPGTNYSSVGIAKLNDKFTSLAIED